MKTQAKKLVHTKNLSRKEWLMWRQEGIGGSDAAGITKLNKYSSPVSVYTSKVEKITDKEAEEEISEAAEWGTRQEPVIREKFKENHPELKVQRSYIMWNHPEYPFMLANVDGVLYDPEKGWGLLEIKTTNEFKKDDWNEDKVPEEYLIQMQHYLAVMGFKWGWFCVLIGGNKYREFYIERDEVLIQSLIQIEDEFWNKYVIPQVRPELDGSSASAEILKRLYPGEDVYEQKEILQLPEEAETLIQQYDEYKESIDILTKDYEAVKQKLQDMLGEYQIGKLGDREVRWTVTRSFNEKKFKEENPDKYKALVMPALDKNALKKEDKKLYESYMLPKSRQFKLK